MPGGAPRRHAEHWSVSGISHAARPLLVRLRASAYTSLAPSRNFSDLVGRREAGLDDYD